MTRAKKSEDTMLSICVLGNSSHASELFSVLQIIINTYIKLISYIPRNFLPKT